MISGAGDLDFVFDDIADERIRQDEKWGVQHHPDGTCDVGSTDMAQAYKEDCQAAAWKGKVTWADILLEEVYEALDEDEWPKLRSELVQVAAVVAAWIQDGDSRDHQE